MKRLLVLALLALGLTIVVAPAATPAAPGDAKGPPCSNITNGDGGYSVDGVLDFTVFLQAPACSFVDYSFFVTDTNGTPITRHHDRRTRTARRNDGRRLPPLRPRPRQRRPGHDLRLRDDLHPGPRGGPSRRTRPIQRVLHSRHRSAW